MKKQSKEVYEFTKEMDDESVESVQENIVAFVKEEIEFFQSQDSTQWRVTVVFQDVSKGESK